MSVFFPRTWGSTQQLSNWLARSAHADTLAPLPPAGRGEKDGRLQTTVNDQQSYSLSLIIQVFFSAITITLINKCKSLITKNVFTIIKKWHKLSIVFSCLKSFNCSIMRHCNEKYSLISMGDECFVSYYLYLFGFGGIKFVGSCRFIYSQVLFVLVDRYWVSHSLATSYWLIELSHLKFFDTPYYTHRILHIIRTGFILSMELNSWSADDRNYVFSTSLVDRNSLAGSLNRAAVRVPTLQVHLQYIRIKYQSIFL